MDEMTRTRPTLPPRAEMLRAFLDADADYDGVFLTGVRTTGIFCRPTCPARKPLPENVEFFACAADAALAGYRPCKRCRPLEPVGEPPAWLRPLLAEVEASPGVRLADADLRARGLAPERVRRWFDRHHGLTFHAWQRARRVGSALQDLSRGEGVLAAGLAAGWESASGFAEAVAKVAGAPPGRLRDATIVRLDRLDTPLGPMVAGASDEHLLLLEFGDRRMLERQLQGLAKRVEAAFVVGPNDLLAETARQLEQWFDGTRRAFDLPLGLHGTPFQQAAWEALAAIPYGQTRSYAEQAAAVGRPSSHRAVARANGDNRLAIVVPCHRVVRSDGTLSGYGGGVWRKQRLLDHERGVLDRVGAKNAPDDAQNSRD